MKILLFTTALLLITGFSLGSRLATVKKLLASIEGQENAEADVSKIVQKLKEIATKRRDAVSPGVREKRIFDLVDWDGLYEELKGEVSGWLQNNLGELGQTLDGLLDIKPHEQENPWDNNIPYEPYPYHFPENNQPELPNNIPQVPSPTPAPRPPPSTATCGVQSVVDDGRQHESGGAPFQQGECGVNKFGNQVSKKDKMMTLLKKFLSEDAVKRVVGGSTAREGRWPWMAALMKVSPQGYSQVCGGALISNRWVLTAAHCIAKDQENPCSYAVQLGENTLVGDSMDIEIIKLDRIIKHKDYSGQAGDVDDIALLRLYKPATLRKDDIEPVCLNTGVTYDRFSCTVAGWGVNQRTTDEQLGDPNHELSTPARLQHTVLPRLTDSQCQGRVHDYVKGLICVGSNNGKDVCSGDSGGPYVCKGIDGKYYSIGVASFVTNGCAIDDSPAVYVSVQYHMTWIRDVIARYGGM